MELQKRKLNRLIIYPMYFLFIFIVSPSIVHGNDAFNKVNMDDHIIMWKDSNIPTDFNKFTKKHPNVNFINTPEVGMTRIETTEEKKLKSIISEVNNKYSSQIELNGTDPDLVHPIKFMLPRLKTAIHVPMLIGPFLDQERAEKGLHEEWAWHIDKTTGGGNSYKIEPGNHATKVAVIDSGIDFNHPDLKNNIVNEGRSFVPGSKTAYDDMGHGTMVAGVIAANGELKGVGPGLGIIPYKVMGARDGESSWVIQAIIAAVKDDVDVINLSLGAYKSLDKNEDVAIIEAYRRAEKFAKKKGVILVASAGNEGIDLTDPLHVGASKGLEGERVVHIPGGGLKNVVVVAATNNQDMLSNISNYGKQVTFVAPGGEVDSDSFNTWCLTTYPTYFPQPEIFKQMNIGEGYMFTAGTSIAAPNVAGSIGVLIAYEKGLKKKYKKNKVNKIINQFKNTSTYLEEIFIYSRYGFGLINLTKVLEKK